ncbi:expressed unknown protein [Seminavis robusta]|uniref:DUF4345 domain-containing protein n=1 Tax=Seminavis robusta TaxID=568900 RepID=A0A9N8DI57_9STRA|nr:expressed unknown protein [Seminavis robusta]|eukprot:Sro157_g071350.1 n/a (126) ;mRNA; f:89559-89936
MFAQVFAIAISSLIGLVGIMYMVDPAGSMVAADIHIESPAGRTEIRGIYAGIHLALSSFLFINVFGDDSLAICLLLILLLFGWAAAGRMVGFLQEGLDKSDRYNVIVTIIEVVLSATSAALYGTQ